MPLFTYKAKNEAGKVFSGEIKIANEKELVNILASKGFTPIEVQEKTIFNDISQISFLKKKVNVKDIALFCRQFAIVLEAGVPIATAMDVIREQTENPTLKEVVADVYDNIQKGISLSDSLKQHDRIFPAILVSMVEAGEVSGQLDTVFKRLADQFEKSYRLNRNIVNSLTYPIIVLGIAVIVIFILMTYVVPTFSGVLRDMGVELPIYTLVLMAISDFFKSWWWAIIIVFFSAVIGISTYSKSESGKRLISSLSIKLPIISGVIKAVMTARLTRTLSTLLSSGVLMIQALEIVQGVLGNVIVSEKIDFIVSEVKKGRGLSQPLSSIGYFPPMLEAMVRIGEESGSIDFTLDKAADYYDEEVETSIQRLVTLLNPVIMIFLGGVVAFVIFSVMVPMFSVYQSLGNQ